MCHLSRLFLPPLLSRLTPTGAGDATRLVHGEDMGGLLVPLLKGGVLAEVDEMFGVFNEEFKNYVESQ